MKNKLTRTESGRNRDSNDFSNEDKKQLAEEGQENVVMGHVYRPKNDAGGSEVIPFSVEVMRARVRFSPVGRSSEDEMRTSDFLNSFEYVGPTPSTSEEPKSLEQQEEDNRKLEEEQKKG